MMTRRSWKWFSRGRSGIPDGGTHRFRVKLLPFMGIVCTAMLFIVYRTNNYQHQHRKMEDESYQFGKAKEPYVAYRRVGHLPRGIVHSRSDLEMRPLWLTNRSSLKAYAPSRRNLLAIAAGVKQRKNVDAIVQKFLPENFTIILFHYDCNVNGWRDLEWSSEAIHIVAHNQTKWWFAKRFLHPDVVSIYDYIFIWDEDLGVNDFHPGKYLKIMKSEGLEISQPALDPDSAEIHHRITIRKKRKKLHRRIYERRGSFNCSSASEGPPCTGWVEGMAPVFSRAAWFCVWHLIQNDLVHGWGMDMKLGYCAQGDRTKKVGIIDSEFIVHKGVQTLGSSSVSKASSGTQSMQRRGAAAIDERSEIRRQSTSELAVFKRRWEKAAKEDEKWVDPFKRNQ